MIVVTTDAEARDVLASRKRPTNVVWNFILVVFLDRFKRGSVTMFGIKTNVREWEQI